MNYNYAIQRKNNGQLIDYCETIDQAERWLDNYPSLLEVVDINHASKIIVTYTELSGPSGYGHQEESFVTYGGISKCVTNLYKWMQETVRTFGPDARDIRDFFSHCSLQVNNTNRTDWLLKQIDKLNIKELYV